MCEEFFFISKKKLSLIETVRKNEGENPFQFQPKADD
jgi:hypothetical protein